MAESEKYISYASAKWHLYREFITDKEAAKKAFRALSAIPADDVRPVKRAHWKEDWEMGCSRCSECGEGFLWEDFDGVAEWNFCPNCGADIRPPKEET